MRAFLARIEDGPFVDLHVDELERLAALDKFGVHELIADPDEADLILFPQCHMLDWRLRVIREHPVARRHWSKVMVYDERDRPWRSFPGVYVSAGARGFDQWSQRTWAYLIFHDVAVRSSDPDLLFSFVGSNSAPCRKLLFELSHPSGLVEEVRDFMFWDERSPGYTTKRAHYQEVLMRSRFVLCPRGRGTSSMRLYETLAAGRVPVIISDEWVAPRGPEWEACSLRWPEGRIEGLIEALEEREQDWPAMSAVARREHAEYFAGDVAFHRLLDVYGELVELGVQPDSPAKIWSRSIRGALIDKAGRTG